MLRAPSWYMSTYRSISWIWLASMTSEISFSPCWSAPARSMRSPSSPCPWKLYGDDRGLKAPPRRNLPPARFTAAAVAFTCSSVSAEHGAQGAGRSVHVEALLDEVRDDVLNLLFAGVCGHHDNHDSSPLPSVRTV